VNQQEKQPRKDMNVLNKNEKKAFSDKLADFISANRILFIGIAIGIVVAIAAVGIYTAVSENVATASSRAMELAEQKLQQWSQETDEQKKADSEKALLVYLDTIAKKWPHTIAAQRALLRKAAILNQKKEYADAEKTALDALARNKNSYAAPIALELAAVSAEEAGNKDAAIAHYTQLAKDYLKDNPVAPHALFNLGRLQEEKSDYKAAMASYNQLVSAFGGSDWALLAKNRIIYLKAKGLAE
jgi:tetratricopeptide (TPR) repeat protein